MRLNNVQFELDPFAAIHSNLSLLFFVAAMSIITNYARTSQQQIQKGKETDLDIVSNDRLI
jgi:hypothetical protein